MGKGFAISRFGTTLIAGISTGKSDSKNGYFERPFLVQLFSVTAWFELLFDWGSEEGLLTF